MKRAGIKPQPKKPLPKKILTVKLRPELFYAVEREYAITKSKQPKLTRTQFIEAILSSKLDEIHRSTTPHKFNGNTKRID